MIELTESAKNKIAEIIRDEGNLNLNLRAYIEGGGCSGFNYGFALEETQQDDDFVIPAGDFKVLVDSISMEYLRGAKIDFKKSLLSSHFSISNPNAKSTCGCGSSFSA
jgi:iron-sulfur cluster insertion protein